MKPSYWIWRTEIKVTVYIDGNNPVKTRLNLEVKVTMDMYGYNLVKTIQTTLLSILIELGIHVTYVEKMKPNKFRGQRSRSLCTNMKKNFFNTRTVLCLFIKPDWHVNYDERMNSHWRMSAARGCYTLHCLVYFESSHSTVCPLGMR